MSFCSVSACFSSVMAPTMGSPTILPLRSRNLPFEYGNIILPFVDRFPKDTELYRVMTTKPNEVSGA